MVERLDFYDGECPEMFVDADGPYCWYSDYLDAQQEVTRLREQLADAEKVIARLDYYARDESSTLVVNHMVQQYRKKYEGVK